MKARWGIAEYLGVGLAVLVGGVGALLLLGLWVMTQRDLALAAGSAEWVRWDRALTIWAYGVLLGLLVLSVGVALWWWRYIGRAFLRLRDQMRALFWERNWEVASFPALPQEAQLVQQTVTHLGQFLHVLEEVATVKRKSLPPQVSEWPPVLQQVSDALVSALSRTTQRQALQESLLREGLEILRHSQREAQVASYLAKASPLFLRSLGAAMGAFYYLEGETLRRVYGYAYPVEAPETFLMGEGWVGQVAREGQALWFNSLPPGYEPVLAGLGRAKPQALAVLPVIAGESIRGVWDLATFTEWDDLQKEKAEFLLPFFAAGLLLAEEAQREKQFYSDLSTLEAQLQAHKEKENRLQAEAYSLQSQAHKLERQLNESQSLNAQLGHKLELVQVRSELILSALSEVVLLFEPNGRLKYCSPAVTQLLGYSISELQVFFRPVEKADAEAVKKYFQDLLDQPEAVHTLRFRYRHKDGHTVWLQAVGRNYLQEPSLQALLLTLRDVTDAVEYEKQYRTRLKFQSLVENSPDIIFRTDQSGRFLYVNPTIERYTGYPPSHYIRNTLYSVGFSLEEVRFWEGLISSVFATLQVQSAEIDFPSVYGVRRMAVRAIPELGPEGEVETLVVLLQDITDLRQAQEQLRTQNLHLEQAKNILEHQKKELEEKNRDIMESITYARRIQGALLAGEAGLAQYFPDSFIMHWLRDVVGGDFYWYGEDGGHMVVAVVDCTGHGVPGAFMTFLGYTLIEGAVRERHLHDPAEILYFMDKRLRQMFGTQDSMQDGMDVALCVIDPERRIVRFAGAHRPLLLYQNATWTLVSGTPTGLGGALWLDEVKRFVTHTFSYQPGDQLYLYTDGYLDQFGYAAQGRYTHKRFREFLATWGHLPMAEQHRMLVEELKLWMGSNALTDDVTVLGIRL